MGMSSRLLSYQYLLLPARNQRKTIKLNINSLALSLGSDFGINTCPPSSPIGPLQKDSLRGMFLKTKKQKQQPLPKIISQLPSLLYCQLIWSVFWVLNAHKVMLHSGFFQPMDTLLGAVAIGSFVTVKNKKTSHYASRTFLKWISKFDWFGWI